MRILWSALFGAALSAFAAPACAQNYPAPKEATFIVKDFRFNTGEAMPEVRLHYRTVGEPSGLPVLILHGTSGSGAGFLNAAFAGELFGPGQPLDATKYFIILPDNIGAGKSSKPSDGLRTKFPRYTYDDIVTGHHRLVTEGLGIKRLRLVTGNSMGGMHTWLWGVTYPDLMDALMPMAAQPTEVSGRNWMTRRMMIELIGPAGMPADVVAKINGEIRAMHAEPEFQKTFLDKFYFQSIAGAPEQLAQFIKSEEPKWRKIIQDAKIKVE